MPRASSPVHCAAPCTASNTRASAHSRPSSARSWPHASPRTSRAGPCSTSSSRRCCIATARVCAATTSPRCSRRRSRAACPFRCAHRCAASEPRSRRWSSTAPRARRTCAAPSSPRRARCGGRVARSWATGPPPVPRSRPRPARSAPRGRGAAGRPAWRPPGMGLLALPFFLPFILAGAPALDLGLLLRVGHLAAAFYETIATLLLWSVLRRLLSERETLALVLLYALGTSVRTIASQALWQHAGVHLAIAFALWLVVRERDPSWRREFLAGVVLGVGGLVRQTTAFVALAIAGPRVGATILALAGAAVGLVPLLMFNNFAFGAPFEQGYGVKPFDTPPLQGVYGLLLSPSRGLFVYEPWALFALGGLVAARLSPTSIARRLATFPFVWILFVVFYATYAEWWGGRGFGPRFLHHLAPILLLRLPWGLREGWFARGLMNLVLWLTAAWSVLIFNAAAFVYDQNKWDLLPRNVNDDPSRLLDWSDPQWLAVLREVPNGGARAIVGVALTLLVLIFLARVEGLIGSRGGVVASSFRG